MAAAVRAKVICVPDRVNLVNLSKRAISRFGKSAERDPYVRGMSNSSNAKITRHLNRLSNKTFYSTPSIHWAKLKYLVEKAAERTISLKGDKLNQAVSSLANAQVRLACKKMSLPEKKVYVHKLVSALEHTVEMFGFFITEYDALKQDFQESEREKRPRADFQVASSDALMLFNSKYNDVKLFLPGAEGLLDAFKEIESNIDKQLAPKPRSFLSRLFG
ncbi:MAG: hypothetical protein WCW13_00010 [archaeon]|jgi:hypothetical protein